MDWDRLIDWLQAHKFLVVAVVLGLSALGFGVSVRTPYITPDQARQSHIAHESRDRYQKVVEALKDNRRWLSYYQSQIAAFEAIAATRPLKPDEQAVLDGLKREQPLLFESREQHLKELEEFKPKADPLNNEQ